MALECGMILTAYGCADLPASAFGAPQVLPQPVEAQSQPSPQLEPRYHVILHDDDKHSYTYVVEMLAEIFGYNRKAAFKLACEVNDAGRAIVATCHKELAELRVDQIEHFEHDPRLLGEGPETMRASMEPAE